MSSILEYIYREQKILAEIWGRGFELRECHLLEEAVDWVELDDFVLDPTDELEELGTDTVDEVLWDTE
jgi:hypothetical protein